MSIAQVQYTVKAGYAAQNKENISRVMEELRALERTDLRYSVFVKDDGKTFVHMLFCESEEAEKVFVALKAFKTFQSALRESHPEVPPAATKLNLVGSSYDLS
jgi:hypothetical protein